MEVQRHIERAWHLLNINRPADAIKEINAGLVLEPQNTELLSIASSCYYETGEYERSMAFARQWLNAEPDNPLVHYIMAINYERTEKMDKAKSHIQQALAYDPTDADYWSALASFYMPERDWNKMLEYAEKGLECDPEHPQSLNYRNLALTKLGRADELKVGIEESLAANPEDAHTHATVGWTKLEIRKYKEARFHFAEALRLQPHNDWARSGMIEALKAKNVFYRLFLMYFFWIAKYQRQSQYAIIIGIYIGTKVLRTAAKAVPILYIPYGILMFAAYLTWIIEPLFNLFVLIDRYGRYLLNRREKTGALLVGCGVALAIALGLTYLYNTNDLLLFPALFFATIVIPVASFYGLDETSRNLKTIGIYTIVLAVLGIISVLLLVSKNDTGLITGMLYLLGMWTFGWVANYLNTR